MVSVTGVEFGDLNLQQPDSQRAMSRLQKALMQRFFRESAGDPSKLPWHHEVPSPFLAAAIEQGAGPRALDVGCGSGFFAALMAEMGLKVTAIDYIPEAIAMAQKLTEARGVEVELVQADLRAFVPESGYGLVFDSGCLHNHSGNQLMLYKQCLLRWLEPGGNYILAHWGKRHLFDWRPIGPRRRTADHITHLFAPELELVAKKSTDESVSFPFGPIVRMANYWFRRVG